MPALNREEFGDVKFNHGTRAKLDELQPSDLHGQGTNYGISKTESAYVTTDESDAWNWAAMGAGRGDRDRVYEVEPYGEVRPDRNTPGAQFEVSGAKIVRELPGPVNSQLALFPGRNKRAFTTFEHIAKEEGDKAQLRVSADRKSRYNPPPQTTQLPGMNVGGEFPPSARSHYPESRHRVWDFEEEEKRYRNERYDQAGAQAERGMQLRESFEGQWP